jgi:hypothetical protein
MFRDYDIYLAKDLPFSLLKKKKFRTTKYKQHFLPLESTGIAGQRHALQLRRLGTIHQKITVRKQSFGGLFFLVHEPQAKPTRAEL